MATFVTNRVVTSAVPLTDDKITSSQKWNNAFTTIQSNSANWILDGGNTKSGALTIGTNNNNNLVLETNNTSRVTILSTGNIGINTTTPNERLTVSGNISAVGFTTMAGTGVVLRINGSGGIFHGMQIKLGDASSSVDKATFIETTNENDHPIGILGTTLFANGASDLTFSTTPAGARTSRREVERMRIDSVGGVRLRGSISTYSPNIIFQTIDASNAVDRIPCIVVSNENDIQVTGQFFYVNADGSSWIDWIVTPRSLLPTARTTDRRLFDISDVMRFAPDLFNNTGLGLGVNPLFQLQLGRDSAGKPNGGVWSSPSDIRLKENIILADIDRCYEIVKSLPLKRYTWKDEIYSNKQISDKSKLGWVAQDVQEVFPKAITTLPQQTFTPTGLSADEVVIENCLSLNADQIYASMYGAMQKLINIVESLEARIQVLES